MIAKRIAKILRGNATPAQMMMACVLGAGLGFMPGFAQAPGLIVLLVLLLIVLNANLALAAMVTAAAKIVSLLLLALSFHVGRLLLDGPTEPLFKMLINMPVLALFGFEYYVVPASVMAKHVSDEHRLWLKSPGVKGQKHKDSSVRTVHLPPYKSAYDDFDLSQYRDRWDLIEERLRA